MFLIAGATSAPGRRVVTSLLERAHPVRVLVRGERDAADFAARGAEVVRDEADSNFGAFRNRSR